MSLTSDLRGDQLAPHSIPAEEAVLGGILINPEALFEVLMFLTSEDFFIVRHAWIWEAIVALHDRHEPVDHLLVCNELDQRGRLGETGGAAYVLSLINKTPSSLNTEGYGRVVEQMAVRRRLIEAAQQVARVAHSDETDIDEVVARSQQAIIDAVIRRANDRLSPIGTVVSSNYDATVAAYREGQKNGGAMRGLSTGLEDVDRMLRGLKPDDLTLVAARPGMGKTSWLLKAARENAVDGIPVGIVSYEMSQEALTDRLVAAEAKLSYSEISEGRIPEDGWPRYIKAVETISQWPIVFYDDSAGATPEALRLAAQRMVVEHGIKMLLVDYVQLMHAPGRGRDENRTQEVTAISRSLKLLARELHIPVVAASQLSRQVESRSDKRPQLSDLRESGSLEQDADVVIFLYRDSHYHPDSVDGNKTEINIAKHRNGPVGTVDVIWLPESMTFVSALRQNIELNRKPVVPPPPPKINTLPDAMKRVEAKEADGKPGMTHAAASMPKEAA